MRPSLNCGRCGIVFGTLSRRCGLPAVCCSRTLAMAVCLQRYLAGNGR
jgi:hypothetical protein